MVLLCTRCLLNKWQELTLPVKNKCHPLHYTGASQGRVSRRAYWTLDIKSYNSTRQLLKSLSIPVPHAIHSSTSALRILTSQGTRTSLGWLPRFLFPPPYSSWDHTNMIVKPWKTLPHLVLVFRACCFCHVYLVLPSRCLPCYFPPLESSSVSPYLAGRLPCVPPALSPQPRLGV